MNEIIYQKSYREYKEELDGVLQRTAEGFVQIGYLLKVARDTNILEESGYKSVAEFAEAEYNLNKTQVSRFISINDKFSEGGYSDHLLPDYQGYGYAKLTIMLQLPDSINEELSPSFSKAEIQAVKDELDEEQRVSDLERYIEGPNERENNLESVDEKTAMLYKTILQLGEDEPELYVTISERKNEDLSIVLPEVMAPAGDKMYSVRVKGVGRMMISISDMSEYVKLINSRTGEKESYTWADVAAGWAYAGVLGLATEEQSGIECWEQRYERKYPIVAEEPKPALKAKTETAWGVKKEEQKPAPKKETKVTKAKTEWESAYKVGQQIIVYANDHIGELIEKSENPGKWKIKFPTYTAEMAEAQFTEYVEEAQLHDVYEEIPRVSGEVVDTKTEKEDNSEQKEQNVDEDYNLPGQMSVEDLEGVVPEKVVDAEVIPPEKFGMNPPIVDDKVENYSSDYHPGKEPMIDALIDHTGKLCKHIVSKEWNMALMDIDMLIDGINRAKAFKEQEDDE